MTLLKPGRPQTATTTKSPSESGWRRHIRGPEGDAWVMLGVLTLGLVTVAALSGITSAMHGPIATRQSPGATSAGQVDARGMASANERVYLLPGANPGLMNPVVDQRGRVWFGEMSLNKLAMLDPATGKVSSWTPPGGQYNIMNEVVDSKGGIWFTEEAANYLARFDPDTQTFKTYPVNTLGDKPAGPEALALDAQGNLWFTEVTAGALGKLDPTTGKFSVYPLPASPTGAPSYPYALTVARDGHVWFGCLSGGTVGWLDPATGKVTQYATPDPKAQVYAMTVGPDSAIYYTQLQTDSFGRINPGTGKITQISVPHTAGAPATLYTALTRDGALWLTSTGANALIRYVPATNQFSFYTLKRPQSVPFGLALAPNGALWFTADGAPNYVGMVGV
jgi:virginiamycin B lyase